MSVIIDSDNNNVNITEEPINVTVSLGGPDVAAVWGGITGDLADQEDLQAVLDDKVPYTGATGDVNLGEYGIQLGNLEFDNTPTNVPTAAGSVYWSDTDGTLNMVLKGGQTISRIGETQHIRALNNTGAQIARGKVVYVVGAQGQRLTIALADADTEILSKDTIGITSEAIADGAEGFVIVQGVINNISTTGMTDGATVYLSQTAGSYTTTPPVDPAHLVVLGFIVNGNSGGAGSIYVKVDNGYELGELHDVNTTGATNGQVLTYNGTTWVPATNGSGTVTSIATSAPITGGTITTSGTIGITQAGAAADGYLSSVDWSTFNNKQAALTLTTTGTSGAATLVGSTLNIPQYQGVLTNPVTGTGTAGQVSYWSGTGTQTGSQDFTWNDTTKILSFSNGGTLINEIRISSVNSNTMMGRLAGSSASLSGGSNSFFGQNSGSANTTGNGNSAFGLRSGNNNTTGSGNVFFGSQAGRYLADGTTSLTVTNNSVFLGFDTRAAADSQTNQIAIGYQAIGLGSNTTVIGNSSTTQTWLGGNLTLGTTTSGGRLTVRGSGTTSSTTALLVQNSTPSNLFKITDDGYAFLGSSANTVEIRPVNSGDGIRFQSIATIDNGVIGNFTFAGNTVNSTTGTHTLIGIFREFAPTSGTATARYINISPTINQTGGANGITRGLYVNPTLTSAADWRSVEFSNNTGWGLYGAGTALNYLGGSTSIGTTTNSARLHIRGSGTTSATTALLVQNSNGDNLLKSRDDGALIIGSRTSEENYIAGYTATTPFGAGQRTLGFAWGTSSGSRPNPAFYFTAVNNVNYTSSTGDFIQTSFTFNPSSGTAVLNTFLIQPTINQTGGANGITRGLYVNPTLTAAADWRSIETSNNTGYAAYFAGTADLFFNDATDLQFGTTTGTKIGTSTSQKIGLWNATPIVQPTTAVAAATRVGGGGTTVTDTDTFDGYTISQIVKALRNIGALA